MPKIEPFEKFPQAYEAWFEKHSSLYDAEIEAIRKILPPFKNGIEIGIGSGRFAVPFGITTGGGSMPLSQELIYRLWKWRLYRSVYL